ncbi:hypothetical protein NXS19_005702 [Fusarium pseudograminearum]|uniref:Uncharacterized protein n=1 Tax=Fusarium pseudograminearum (strain CS3096) TaxID=1028729 RepID=K3VCY7_FUSPC|nr:hypothetical protein FPSE_08238 [Fusarium pseudograminearum CS3096]EKJ71599.1 hypothetical protein FPSE_08238 [Fusarium pseudograminearum CS3096]KAF0638131.1 hypothetical protein FPSE5266_08238 [Fusarium pseudograminearum]UZP37886.1 hypothetical protein NXS19_005702 [Fusarium pseudograminearum]
MSDAHDKYGDGQPLSEETREDLRRMTLGLTDQKTIDTLTRVGMVAKFRRQSSRNFHEDDKAEKKTGGHQEKATAETADEYAVKKHVSQGDVKNGGTESDKDKDKKQV